MEQYNNYPQNTVNYAAKVAQMVNDAFGKCLAACIMAWFPVASIIAIVTGNTGLRMLEEAKAVAAQTGVDAGGKAIASKILGMIGKIGGIVCTALYGLYFVTFFFALLANL